MSGEMVRWLGEQLDEDERIARGATPGPWEQVPQRVGWLASEEYWTVVDCSDTPLAKENAQHVAAHDPSRVLREVDAKRQLIADLAAETHHVDPDDGFHTCAAATEERDGGASDQRRGGGPGPCDCGRDERVARRLRLLALPYTDRPGYREEWRP